MAKQDSASAHEPSGIMLNGNRLLEYFVEARGELKKVTWPTKKDLRITCIAVVVMVLITAIFLSLADLGLSRIVRLILY
jgi:preprotein translocase subunit SecE